MLTDERIEDKLFEHPPTLGKLTAQEALLQILKEQMGPHRDICLGLAGHLEGMGENERGSVLSAAKTQTQWLDDKRMKDVLSRSDFRMADLKRKRTTIYLCLPAMRMGTHARWLRLMILLALSVMERTKAKPPAPVLFVLDEFPVLGHIQSIETAAGLMAGFGVKLWVIVQNVGQLKQHYEKAWETFIANSGALTAFGVVDQESLKVLSDKLGRMRMVEQVSTGAVGSALVSGAAAFRDEHHDVPLAGRARDRAGFQPGREAPADPWRGMPARRGGTVHLLCGPDVRRALRASRSDEAAMAIRLDPEADGCARPAGRDLGGGPEFVCAGRLRPCPRCLLHPAAMQRRACCNSWPRWLGAAWAIRGSAALGSCSSPSRKARQSSFTIRRRIGRCSICWRAKAKAAPGRLLAADGAHVMLANFADARAKRSHASELRRCLAGRGGVAA